MLLVARILLALAALIAPSLAFAQGALQGGPGAPGHVPMYVGISQQQTFLVDSGPAGGGGVGVGLSELGLQAVGTGIPPFAGQGTGPLGTNVCDYDGPITNATGYHYLCFSPNAQGGGLIAYGAAGGASNLPLQFSINGVLYQFPPALVIGTTAITGGTLGNCLTVGAGGVLAQATCGSGGGGGITIGSTTVTGGSSGFILYNNAGVAGNLATTGSGSVVEATSPTIASPTITGAFTATGLVTNADLANAATTVNTVTCTLGSPCTVAAAAGTLTGTTLASNVVTSSLTTVGTIGTGVWQGTAVAVAFGGTNCTVASGTCLDNITGFASTGIAVRTGAGTYAFDSVAAGSGIAVTNGSGVAGNPTVALAAVSADQLLLNASGSSAVPSGVAFPSCSSAANGLTYNTTTHALGCNTFSGSGTVNSGTAGQLAWYPASTNVVNGNANVTVSAGAVTLGVASTTIGQLLLEGNTSGAVTLTPQAVAGTPTITFGTNTGTPAVTAASPLAITTATGNITCLTCATTTNGGALSASAPVVISAGGAISITGVAGQVLAGAGPAFTATPTLGAAAVATGQLKLSGTTSGTVTLSVSDAAGSWTMKLPTGTGSAGQFLETDGAGISSWANATGAGTVNSGAAGQVTWYASNGTTVSGNANANISAGALTLGQASSTLGQLLLEGSTSGAVTLTPQAVAGTPTITFGTSSGTPAVTASSPLAIVTATGNITCLTCATTTNGGALSGTAPVAISAAGAVSITGAAGQVLAGATPAFTATPTLGAAGTLGSLTFGNATSGLLTLQTVTGALGTVTVSLPAATDTLVGRATTDTLTNKSIAGSEINSGLVTASVGGTGVNNGLNTITVTTAAVQLSPTSNGLAAWQSANLSPYTLATYNGSQSNPTPTSSASLVMMGFGGAATITPGLTTRVLIAITGDIFNATAIGDGAAYSVRYGTGTAPVNGAAVTGTACGPGTVKYVAATTAQKSPFSVTCLASGLSVSTAYWIDLALQQTVGGTASVNDVHITAHEL